MMKILVIPKSLEIGGSQIATADLASALADRGHNVVLAADRGPLEERLSPTVDSVPLPPLERRMQRVSAIRRLLSDVDRSGEPFVVIHATEVRGVFDASIASGLLGGPPVLGSIFSTRVPWFLPESVPLTVGMPSLHRFTERWRMAPTYLLPAPVAPLEVHVTDRAEEVPALDRLAPHTRLAVLVSRLVEPFKREGILRTIVAMESLARNGMALLIVGEGEARSLYEDVANTVNRKLGRRVIAFAGEMVDPGPALRAADVVVGNGMSVLGAAMSGVPAVVVGREGFSTVVGHSSLDLMIDQGFYGVGSGLQVPDVLPSQIQSAVTGNGAPGSISQELNSRYGLGPLAVSLEKALVESAGGSSPDSGELMRALARMAHYRLRRTALRMEARRRGLHAEQNDNFVYGSLRDLSLIHI